MRRFLCRSPFKHSLDRGTKNLVLASSEVWVKRPSHRVWRVGRFNDAVVSVPCHMGLHRKAAEFDVSCPVYTPSRRASSTSRAKPFDSIHEEHYTGVIPKAGCFLCTPVINTTYSQRFRTCYCRKTFLWSVACSRTAQNRWRLLQGRLIAPTLVNGLLEPVYSVAMARQGWRGV